jgi:hypothetical protein
LTFISNQISMKHNNVTGNYIPLLVRVKYLIWYFLVRNILLPP